MARREVKVGQHYQPQGSSMVWEVRELARDGEGVGHARLVRTDNAREFKTLSVSALKDNKLYRLVKDSDG